MHLFSISASIIQTQLLFFALLYTDDIHSLCVVSTTKDEGWSTRAGRVGFGHVLKNRVGSGGLKVFTSRVGYEKSYPCRTLVRDEFG